MPSTLGRSTRGREPEQHPLQPRRDRLPAVAVQPELRGPLHLLAPGLLRSGAPSRAAMPSGVPSGSQATAPPASSKIRWRVTATGTPLATAMRTAPLADSLLSP